MLNKLFILILTLTIVVLGRDVEASDFISRESARCERHFTRYERATILPSRLLKAISTQESGRWSEYDQKKVPWPWTVNVNGKGYYFDTKKEAIEKVKYYRSLGNKSIDVGCMQVNLMYHPDAFANLEEAFDPQKNVKYAAQFLRTLYDRNSSWKMAVASYHTGGATETPQAKKYAAKVLGYWRTEIDLLIAHNTKGKPARTLARKDTKKQTVTAKANNRVELVQNLPQDVPTAKVSGKAVAATEVLYD